MQKQRDVSSALAVSERVYDAVLRHLHNGVSELDLYAVIMQSVEQGCAGHSFEFQGDFISGPRTGGIEGAATERRLELGDAFLLDLSIRFDSAWCDTCRTFYLGQPTLEQRAAYRAALACMKAAERLIRPGVTGEQVKDAMDAVLTQQGFGGRMPHHGGHAVGDFPFGAPVFEKGSGTPLQTGEIFTLEPGVYFPGQWGLRVENDYLLTEDGAKTLFTYPTDMEHFIVEE